MVELTEVWTANLHLHFRLRQSYGDLRLVEEAPGHLFLDYERADLLSFIQVGILNGWDMRAYRYPGYGSFSLNHYEFFEVQFSTPELLSEWAEEATRAGLEFRILPTDLIGTPTLGP